jgi:oligoribonuclease NrnB/cAMP/cGMP phosphodiesterase (DHH superfamily)
MKAQFIKKFLLCATILQLILIEVFSLKNTINTIIDEKVNIRKSNDLKNIFEMNPLIKNETNYKNEIILKEQNNIKYKKLLGERRDSKIFNVTSIISNLITDDISNITKRFSCFYFNEEDFSVYDLSQLDKAEY